MDNATHLHIYTRLHQVLQEGETESQEAIADGCPLTLQLSVLNYQSNDIRDFIWLLLGHFNNPTDYENRLDTAFSPLAQIRPTFLHQKSASITNEAVKILLRLPESPARILQTPYLKCHRYFTGSMLSWGGNEGVFRPVPHLGDEEDYERRVYHQEEEIWADIVRHWPLSSNTLKIALATADTLRAPEIDVARRIRQYVSFLGDVARLLHNRNDFLDPKTINVDSSINPIPFRQETLTIWEIYISICWQHSRMLLYHYILAAMFTYGWSKEWATMFDVQDIDNSGWSITYAQPKYLCSQALALLHRSKGSARFDCRTLFTHFRSIFADRAARCDPGDPNYTCRELVPQSCARFYGQVTADQSMHDIECDGQACILLVWDEQSYDVVDGVSRAIDFDSMGESQGPTRLLYRQADNSTLAISHVWSHGQGGRPETGFNSCLHRRYVTIARQLKCSSYWIDACCIPTDDARRMQAITGINGVFEESRATLVCDQDLMAVGPDDVESILAVLLVADWNVRAWTLLEGLRGRGRLNFLCARNTVVSFSSLCTKVFSTGAIDLVISLAALQHLLPGMELSYEESGFMLGRRIASRSGDKTIIWGLLATGVVTKVPEGLVKKLEHVKTGFLVSNMPRVQEPGLGWAPAVAHHHDDFSGSDGDGSDVAAVTADGLVGDWLVHHIDNKPRNVNADEVDIFYVSHIPLAIALEGLTADGSKKPPGSRFCQLALLHSKCLGCADPYFGRDKHPSYRKVVLCGSNDGRAWHWIQVASIDGYAAHTAPRFSMGPRLGLEDFSVETLLLV